jgi:dienelactone hydrolase
VEPKWDRSGSLYCSDPPCITTYIDDTEVTDHPIRIFHGILDDYVEIAPCRAYAERLKQTAKHIQMTEYPDTWHAFDYPRLQSTPTVVWNAQTTHCVLKEEPMGTIINTETTPSRMQTSASDAILTWPTPQTLPMQRKRLSRYCCKACLN